MTLKPYPAYSPAALGWLDAVPEGWAVEPVRNVIRFTTGWTPPTENSDSFSGEHLWANISDLGPKRLTETEKRLSPDAVKLNRIPVSPEGSLLFSFKLSIGVVSIADRDMYTNEAIATFLPSDRLLISFAFYALPECVVMNASENIYGAPMLNARLIRSARVVIPPVDEQRQIANYLDAQTAKIDALIGKQEQLIETLAERRQAVISHAVTKGLDPNVPMKDSGVEWLGQVPIAWSVEAIKRRGLIGAGTGFPPEFQGLEEEEFPFHKVNVLSKADHDGMIRVRSDSVSRETASLLRARIYPAGSLVMAKIGAALLLGRIRVLGTAACIDNNMMCVQPKDKVSSRFLFWALEMVQFDWLVNPGAVPSTSEGAMGNYKLAFPPAEEQSAVANYLDRETAQIDALVAKAGEMIDVLKERRQALISAAVTGKIDVRTASGD